MLVESADLGLGDSQKSGHLRFSLKPSDYAVGSASGFGVR